MRRRSSSPSYHLESKRTTNFLTIGRSSDAYKDLFKSWLDSSESVRENKSLQAVIQLLITHGFKVDPSEMTIRAIGELLTLSLAAEESLVSNCGGVWSISAHPLPLVGPLHFVVSKRRLSSLQSQSDIFKVGQFEISLILS